MTAIELVDLPRSGWTRLAGKDWADPVDASHSGAAGGRWNAPGAADTLYLNGNMAAAYANLRDFTGRRGYDPDELSSQAGPDLVEIELPGPIEGADLTTADGLTAVGLPPTYPLAITGEIIGHEPCQVIGQQVRDMGIPGIYCRCAQTRDGVGRELAWFPEAGEVAAAVERTPFSNWYGPAAS